MPSRAIHIASDLKCSFSPVCTKIFKTEESRARHERRSHLQPYRSSRQYSHDFTPYLSPNHTHTHRRSLQIYEINEDAASRPQFRHFVEEYIVDEDEYEHQNDFTGATINQSGGMDTGVTVFTGLNQQEMCLVEEPSDSGISIPVLTGPIDNRNGNDIDSSSTNLSRLTLPSQGMISTNSEVVTTTFFKATSRKAGSIVSSQGFQDHSGYDLYNQVLQNPGFPFASEGERSLFFWFFSSDLTAGEIDRFFKIPDVQVIDQDSGNSIRSKGSTRYKACLDKLNIGLADETSDWLKTTWQQCGNDGNPQTYFFIRRRLECVIRFLLGHQPFKADLVYAPVRNFSNNERLYTEMHTCDWWWHTQELLPAGATVVPLIISTDKTLLTQSHGDKSAWPVYLTIGNLLGHIRRKPGVPSKILLGLIPISKNKHSKNAVFHEAMSRMLASLPQLTQNGFLVRCADLRIRKCHPVLAAYCADYEEACTITGIKSQQHCPICLVLPNEKEKLLGRWDHRTNQNMAELRAKQAAQRIPKTHPEWVHPDVLGFYDNLPLVNIYSSFVPDLLHQIYKGVLKHMLEWSYKLLKESNLKCPPTSVNDIRTHAQRAIDRRFANIPSFYGLRKFPDYSNVKQWSGSNYREISRIMVMVFAPLFTEINANDATQCLRALADFIRLAEYRSHDAKTIQYMEHALFRLDKHVEIFRRVRSKDPLDEGHFNFPKWHSMSHYTWFIRQYGALPDLCTSHFERAHIETIKRPYLRTNKQFDFESQLVLDNSRRMKMMTLDSIRKHINIQDRKAQEAKTEDATKLTYASNIIPFYTLGWGDGNITEIQASRSRLNELGIHSDILWRSCAQVAQWSAISGLPRLISKFVEDRRLELDIRQLEEQTRREGVADIEPMAAWRETLIDHTMENGEIDIAGIRSRFPQVPLTTHQPRRITVNPQDLYIAVHPSIHTFKQLGKDGHDLSKEDEEIIRCSPRWQGQGGVEASGRYDCIWFDEPMQGRSSTAADVLGGRGISGLDGMEVGQMRLIFSVIDPDKTRVTEDGKHRQYCGVVIDAFKPRKGIDHITGTIILDRQSQHVGRRVIDLPCVMRSAHLVPMGDITGPTFYINNYADFQQFNTIFDDEFLSKGVRAAEATKLRLLQMHEKVKRTGNRAGRRPYSSKRSYDAYLSDTVNHNRLD